MRASNNGQNTWNLQTSSDDASCDASLLTMLYVTVCVPTMNSVVDLKLAFSVTGPPATDAMTGSVHWPSTGTVDARTYWGGHGVVNAVRVMMNGTVVLHGPGVMLALLRAQIVLLSVALMYPVSDSLRDTLEKPEDVVKAPLAMAKMVCGRCVLLGLLTCTDRLSGRLDVTVTLPIAPPAKPSASSHVYDDCVNTGGGVIAVQD